MIQLPIKKAPPIVNFPRALVIYSLPKVGKTPVAAGLPGNLIVDMEDGSDFIDALRVSVIGLMPPEGETETQKQARYSNVFNGNPKPLYYMSEVIMALRDSIAKGTRYPAITLDTLSKLEDWCEEDATTMYMKSSLGSSFNRWTVEDQNLSRGQVIAGQVKPKHAWESVLTLPYGAGTRYLQDSFRRWIDYFRPLTERLILMAHVKVASINKAGKEVESKDLDLMGKVKTMTTGLVADAFGYMYREENKNYISFIAGDPVAGGSRAKHIEGKTILISEKLVDGTIKTYWENIYPQ